MSLSCIKPEERVIQFLAQLKHIKGEWARKPFILDPWQDSLVRDVFGTLNQDGYRQYRTVYLEVPRKNGKSTLSAGLSLYMLLADREPGAEVYCAAADRDQANIVFSMAKQMVAENKTLAKRCKLYRNRIEVPKTGNIFKVLSADANTKHGFNAHAIIIDELHAQTNRDLWDVLRTSTGSRRQPLTIAITTAGYDRNSICYEQHDYAKRVRDGEITDPTFYPAIYGIDTEDDWTDPKVWAKANPNLGISVYQTYLEAECNKAQNSPAYENTFRRLHLNQWTEQSKRWMSLLVWDKCSAPPVSNKGDLCYIGLDLATTTDIAAMSMVFPREDGSFDIRLEYFVPEENARERERKDKVPYTQWIREGLIHATPGNVIDYDYIRNHVSKAAELYSVKEVAIDRWNATQIATQLQSDGITVCLFGQGFASMASPTKRLYELVLDEKLRHGGCPVLRWMMGNTAVKQDAAGNHKPDKEKSTEKIDGVVATIMGLGRALVHQEEDFAYTERGIRYL